MRILLAITNGGMTRFHESCFLYLLILSRVYSYEVVTGELSFDMRISDVEMPFERALDEINLKLKKKILKDDDNDDVEKRLEDTHEENKKIHHIHQMGHGRVTVGPIVECLYQYPDIPQFKALLSSMMNELTKVFIRVNKQLRKDIRRQETRLETRFRVVAKKDTDFFEEIYTNMTKEYSDFYNGTTTRVARAVEDPCNSQDELKKLWKELLDNSLACIRRASSLCFEEFLRTNTGDEKETRVKLNQYLGREMERIRSRQLHMLCDNFQLCYNDLL